MPATLGDLVISFNHLVALYYGNIEVGLAATSDGGLSTADRLVIYNGRDVSITVRALITASNVMTTQVDHRPDQVKSFITCASFALVVYGLAARVDGDTVDGGDYDLAEFTIPDQAKLKRADTMINPKGVRDAMVAILAAKLSFFMTNHHTGSGGATSWIRKVITLIFGDSPDLDGHFKNAIHTASHWCSTHVVLAILGIKTGRRIEQLFYHPGMPVVSLTDDMAIRVNGLPAGTARGALFHAAASRLHYGLASHVIPKDNK